MPIKPHKLGIIGVGRVGDAVLSDAMMSGLFGEICVIDVNAVSYTHLTLPTKA